MSITCLSCAEAGSGLATGVTGKECVLLAETEEKILVRENCFDVEGFSPCPSDDGVPGTRKTVFSPSVVKPFFLKLLWGNRLLSDFDLVEIGLGGNPPLMEPGLKETYALAEDDVFSNVLDGICKEDRLGGLREV